MIASRSQFLRQALLWLGPISCSLLMCNSSVIADERVEILNTSTINFAPTPNTASQTVSSNGTSLSAIVNQAGLEIIKTADRAAAEPGDTVVYRLLIKNTGATTLTNVVVQDTPPLGLQFLPKSLRASIISTTTEAAITLPPPTVTPQNITFTNANLGPQQTLSVVYAVVLTPDSIRGSGRNVASARAASNTQTIRSNTASYQLKIRPGILSDCGTLIGRVFVDKNFDGEQQPNEPGVPNAVIYLDDGNRITTDASGLFSMSYVISGHRTGTLDLTSLPGYTIAPNQYRIENNSVSRMVKLAPGSLGRMNFAVTPTFGEGRR